MAIYRTAKSDGGRYVLCALRRSGKLWNFKKCVRFRMRVCDYSRNKHSTRMVPVKAYLSGRFDTYTGLVAGPENPVDRAIRCGVGRTMWVAVELAIDEIEFHPPQPAHISPDPGPNTEFLRRLKERTDFGDATLKAIDGELVVHRLVLCTASDYFDTMFAERNAKLAERREGVVHLPCSRAVMETTMMYQIAIRDRKLERSLNHSPRMIVDYLYTRSFSFPESAHLIDFIEALNLLKIFQLGPDVISSLEMGLCSYVIRKANDISCLLNCLLLSLTHSMEVLQNVCLTTLSCEYLNKFQNEEKSDELAKSRETLSNVCHRTTTIKNLLVKFSAEIGRFGINDFERLL